MFDSYTGEKPLMTDYKGPSNQNVLFKRLGECLDDASRGKNASKKKTKKNYWNRKESFSKKKRPWRKRNLEEKNALKEKYLK